MLRSAVLACTVIAGLVSHVYAQSQSHTPSTVDPNKPISREALIPDFDKIIGSLREQMDRADSLAKNLKAAANMKPEDAGQQLDKAQQVLSSMADKLRDNGDMLSQLRAIREASKNSLDRVDKMSPDEIDEADRAEVVKRWNDVLTQIDQAQAAAGRMRETATSTLSEIRLKQRAIRELILAGATETAVRNLNEWINGLRTQIDNLKANLNLPKPMS